MSIVCTDTNLLKALIIEHVLTTIKNQYDLISHIAKNKTDQTKIDKLDICSVIPEHVMLGAISEFGELLESSKRWKWWKINDRNLEDILNCLIELADLEHFTATIVVRLPENLHIKFDYTYDIDIQQFIDTAMSFDNIKEATLIKDYLIEYVKAVSDNNVPELIKLLSTKHRELAYAYIYDAINMIHENINTEINLLDLEQIYSNIVQLKHKYNIQRQKQQYGKTNNARMLKFGDNMLEDNDLIKAYVMQQLVLLVE